MRLGLPKQETMTEAAGEEESSSTGVKDAQLLPHVVHVSPDARKVPPPLISRHRCIFAALL